MERNQESFKPRNIHLLILSLSVLAVLFTQQAQPAAVQDAQAADDDNIFSLIGQAQNDGRDAGQADAEAGYPRNPNCQGQIGYCIAFNHGYNEAYNAVDLLDN